MRIAIVLLLSVLAACGGGQDCNEEMLVTAKLPSGAVVEYRFQEGSLMSHMTTVQRSNPGATVEGKTVEACY